jgi:hypothetical protein
MITLTLIAFAVISMTLSVNIFLHRLILKFTHLRIGIFETFLILSALLLLIISTLIYFDRSLDSVFISLVLIVICSFFYALFNFSKVLEYKRFEGLNLFVVFAIVLILFLSFVFSSDLFNFTFPNRVGPDGFGYLTSANYLLSDRSLSDLREYYSKLFAINYSPSLFSPQNIQVINHGFLSRSIAGEFLLGANRLAIPGLLVIASKFFPFINIFQVGTLFILISIFLSYIISYFVLVNFIKNNLLRVIVSLAYSLNVVLLSVTFDGGLNQYLTTNTLLLYFYFLLTANNKYRDVIRMTSLLVVSFLIYGDVIFYLGLVTVLYFIVLIYTNRSVILEKFKLVLFSYSISLLLCIPWLIFIVAWIPRRLKDASQGGWPQNHWIGLSDFISITNSFSNPTLSTVPRYGFNLLAFSLINLILILLIFYVLTLKFIETRLQILARFNIGLLIIFLLLNSILMFYNESTYAILKFSATLGPIFVLIVLILIFKHESIFLSLKFFSYILISLILVNSLNYVREIKKDNSFVSSQFLNNTGFKFYKDLSTSHNIFLGDGLGKFDSFNYILSSMTDFYNINGNTDSTVKMIDLNQIESRAKYPIAIITNPSIKNPDTFYSLMSACGYKILIENSDIIIFEFSVNSNFVDKTLRQDVYAYIKSTIKEDCGVN